MRARVVAAVAVLSAAAGVAAALAIGRETGWLGATTAVRIVAEEASTPAVAARAAAPIPGRFDAAAIYSRRAGGVVTILAVFNGTGIAQQGSGFVVSHDGMILTNAHVITDASDVDPANVRAADRLYVQFADRDRVVARVVGWDLIDDVGVIRVDPRAHPLEPVPLGNSHSVVVGEPVATIGSPLSDASSLSVGVVSATQRSIASQTSAYQLVDAIQTDAAINHGDSGGPLLDARGAAIGINAQVETRAQRIGFAVPIDSARRSLAELRATGRVRYAYVGMSAQDLTPSIARRFGIAATYGAAVASVTAGSPADKAGFRAGSAVDVDGNTYPRGSDVVVAIDGRPIVSADDFVRVVTERLRPGRTARFTVVRGTRRLTVPVKPVDRPLSPH